MNKSDYFGKELNIGDTVIYHDTHYREFKEGKITKFTPQFVFLEFQQYPYSIKQRDKQLIKKEND